MDILEIHDIRLLVKLGCSTEEQAIPQSVSVNLTLKFLEGNKGAATDSYKDTLCYGHISEKLEALCQGREFFLVEALGHFFFKNLKSDFPKGVLLKVATKKIAPPVLLIKGGVTFYCGDEF